MPPGLYNTSSAKVVNALVGLYPMGNNTALEMVYRLNIGRGPISPNADTGMYRTWDTADQIYLDNISKIFSLPLRKDAMELNFIKVPKYSAPKPVYTTGRSIRWDETTYETYNLTRVFPLDPKFYYLVRLYFYEIGDSD
ncbi:putative non-specific serine/threonine protein kinase [Rosa chinensis]|uniref:Putative non-specific serine/threonine protein kinase n=1 Tax=Rosa chinensis TaxID=74649 RepID=A0A2P6QST0_ROSCH|nr:putative non-specific serine/threonine protein kinase [Rosa chinensis]